MSLINRIRDIVTGRKAPPPYAPPPIRIAGIYTVCTELRLAKTYRPEYIGRSMLVRMTSGRDAIFRYTAAKCNSGLDWDWHIFTFDRYAHEGEMVDLPRYC